MAYTLEAGIQVSLDNSNWFKLTDHNRKEIVITPELIQSESRMANGLMKKYVIAKKNKITTSWTYVPTKTSECVDGNHGAAWLEAFYNVNFGTPVYVKIVASEIEPLPAYGTMPSDNNFKPANAGSQTFTTYMSSFSKNIINRTHISDYVSMTIEFTEL